MFLNIHFTFHTLHKAETPYTTKNAGKGPWHFATKKNDCLQPILAISIFLENMICQWSPYIKVDDFFFFLHTFNFNTLQNKLQNLVHFTKSKQIFPPYCLSVCMSIHLFQTQKLNKWQILKTRILTNIPNWNWDKTYISNCDKTQKQKLWQKLKNWNCD